MILSLAAITVLARSVCVHHHGLLDRIINTVKHQFVNYQYYGRDPFLFFFLFVVSFVHLLLHHCSQEVLIIDPHLIYTPYYDFCTAIAVCALVLIKI